MFRNYVTAALRNLVRNRLYAGINIIGLALGFTAAIFAALFVRNELTYNRWVPGYERTYAVATAFSPVLGSPREERLAAYRDAGPAFGLAFPQIESVARLGEMDGVLHRGNVRAEEDIAWADVDFFSVIPASAVAGNLHTALDRPDSIVLARSFARKYFGYDTPVGEVLELDQMPLRVTAVIEDWPSNSSFNDQAFVSERAPFLFWKERLPWQTISPPPPYAQVVQTFVRLRPGTSAEQVQRGLRAFVDAYIPTDRMGEVSMRLVPLAGLQLAPLESASWMQQRAGLLAAIYGVASIGVLIVLAAIINFVNAMTARAARRAVEVGVRKITGAARHQLIIQFIGEAVVYAALAMAIAVGLVTFALPAFQGLLDLAIPFEPWRDPVLMASMAAFALASGILAGVYPAFILSALRPAAVLKAGGARVGSSGVVRYWLVTLQFALLIGLMLGTAVIYRQADFAINEGMRLDQDQVLHIGNGCIPALKSQIEALPGVRGAACTWSGFNGAYDSTVTGPGGVRRDVSVSPIDYGFFEVFGLKPLAGRFFSRQYGEDVASADGSSNPSVVINESAVRALGFANPKAALGQTVTWRRMLVARKPVDTVPAMPSRIVGVVADVVYSVSSPVRPTIYYADMAMAAPAPEYGPGWDRGQSVFVKLAGGDIPQTLKAIDRLWDRAGDPTRPISRQFLDQEIELRNRDLTRQVQVIAVFAGVAVIIAIFGLFGLSAFTAEQRTKEIGIRKVMGASKREILRLLLWQLTKPVFWANLLAWPAGYLIMKRWLEGFAYHSDLEPWMFLTSSALALAIAVLTVIGHAFLVARAKPVAALRYE